MGALAIHASYNSTKLRAAPIPSPIHVEDSVVGFHSYDTHDVITIHCDWPMAGDEPPALRVFSIQKTKNAFSGKNSRKGVFNLLIPPLAKAALST